MWYIGSAGIIEQPQPLVRRPGHQQQLHERQRIFDSTWWTKTQPATMASRSPNRNWKTADWKASGQLKTLEKEQADVLKSFSRHLNELEGYLTQKKTMTAEGADRCFIETYDNLEDNQQQQRLLLKPKYFESFDNDTKRMLEEKSKVLPWVVDKVADLRDIEDCRAVVVDYRKHIAMVQINGRFCSNREQIVRARKEIESRNFKRIRKTDTVWSGGTIIRKARWNFPRMSSNIEDRSLLLWVYKF